MLKFCDSPWTTVNIASDGQVSLCLCGRWAIRNTNAIGNLHKSSLKSMFETGPVKEFRNSILDQSYRYCDSSQCPRIWNLKQVESFDIVKTYPSLPTHLMLAIDSTCNLTCGSCRRQSNYSPMINLDAQRILNSLKESYKDFDHPVLFQGDGSGDIFSSATYLEFLKSNDLPECFQFGLLTNGTLLSKNLELVEHLHKKIRFLTVSFDAATASTYKRVRGANFNIVLDGVKAAIDMGIGITAQFVLQRENYQEVLAYRDLCVKLGVEHMGIQKLVRWPHITNHWWEYNKLETNSAVDYNQLIPSLEEFKLTHTASVDGGINTMIDQYRHNAITL